MSNPRESSVSFNREHIAHHFQVLHYLAQRFGHPGILVLAAFGEDPTTGEKLSNKVSHFQIGDHAAMTAAAMEVQGAGLNVHMPLAFTASVWIRRRRAANGTW